MKLDRPALIIVAGIACLWALAIIAGALTAGQFGFFTLISLLIAGYFIGSVISQRLTIKEDDYYDKVEK